MPKYYCDYCETSLTHDSPSVRKTHNQGKKHKENVRCYYNQWIGDKAQHIIDMYIDQYKLTLKRNPNFLSSNPAQQTSAYVNPMIPAPLLPPPPGVPLPDGTIAQRPPMPPPGMPGVPPSGQTNPGFPMPMMWPPQPGQFMPPYPPPPMMQPSSGHMQQPGHMPPPMQPPHMMGYAQPMFNPVPSSN